MSALTVIIVIILIFLLPRWALIPLALAAVYLGSKSYTGGVDDSPEKMRIFSWNIKNFASERTGATGEAERILERIIKIAIYVIGVVRTLTVGKTPFICCFQECGEVFKSQIFKQFNPDKFITKTGINVIFSDDSRMCIITNMDAKTIDQHERGEHTKFLAVETPQNIFINAHIQSRPDIAAVDDFLHEYAIGTPKPIYIAGDINKSAYIVDDYLREKMPEFHVLTIRDVDGTPFNTSLSEVAGRKYCNVNDYIITNDDVHLGPSNVLPAEQRKALQECTRSYDPSWLSDHTRMQFSIREGKLPNTRKLSSFRPRSQSFYAPTVRQKNPLTKSY